MFFCGRTAKTSQWGQRVGFVDVMTSYCYASHGVLLHKQNTIKHGWKQQLDGAKCACMWTTSCFFLQSRFILTEKSSAGSLDWILVVGVIRLRSYLDSGSRWIIWEAFKDSSNDLISTVFNLKPRWPCYSYSWKTVKNKNVCSEQPWKLIHRKKGSSFEIKKSVCI